MLSAREAELLRLRLHNQRLTGPGLKRPEAVVEWMGAVQAQEYAVARWGVGQRTAGLTDADVERAFDEGRILRTHVMRPTWHFVSPKDIRWMQMLTSPRVHAANASYYRRSGLDEKLLAKSARVLERALRDGKHLTRAELGDALERAGIPARGQLLAYVMMRAELDALVCSGPRRGSQFTYALLEERVPPAPALSREDALAELTRRFFTSHGPATVKDYVWWSGLRVAEAKTGIELVRPALDRETVGTITYYFAPSTAPTPLTPPAAWLAPIYDEFLIAYKDRGLSRPLSNGRRPPAPIDPFANFLIVDGRFTGTWKRHPTADAPHVRVIPLRPLKAAERRALASAVERYSNFVGLRLKLTIG